MGALTTNGRPPGPSRARELAALVDGSPYRGYIYAYPHKTAYRPLPAPRPLRDVWAAEPLDALFLYLHVPFCEMRCGFCNLFTTANPPDELPAAYLDALGRQAAVVAEALGGRARFARVAVGGGTPTYLEPAELDRLLGIATEVLGADLAAVPLAVETSPATATPDRLAVLRDRGTTRISMGVQSFLDDETRALGRPQRRARVERALADLRAAGFPVLNLDLIYGIAGQTPGTLRASLDAALAWAPEELYLYPLYVRPLTGLGRRRDRGGARDRGEHDRDARWDEQRLTLYRTGRDHLLAAGYEQVSMRMFRRPGTGAGDEPAYCCQEDGMVGVGCGARSYTAGLHYSFDYAVGVPGVRAILDDYLRRGAGGFRRVELGFELDGDEQRRRWLLKSLLRVDGVDLAAYHRRFGTEVTADFPELARLAELGLVTVDGAGPPAARLTPEGLERSDAIGPWLASERVRAAMREYQPR